MLVEFLTYGGTAMFAFVVGAAVGAHNVPTVQRAIVVIKAAETNAKDTLDKITAHKAS